MTGHKKADAGMKEGKGGKRKCSDNSMSHLVSPIQIYERLAKVLFLAVIAIFLWFLYLSLQSSRFRTAKP